jgi:type IV pilus assembly protein PilC
MFDQAASMLQSDVNNALDRSLKLVEPIMMVVVGLLVGGLLIGLYLPIFNLSSVMM